MDQTVIFSITLTSTSVKVVGKLPVIFLVCTHIHRNMNRCRAQRRIEKSRSFTNSHLMSKIDHYLSQDSIVMNCHTTDVLNYILLNSFDKVLTTYLLKAHNSHPKY
jgi:hypothetical protein